MRPHELIIGGSSITCDLAWPTWATWCKYRYDWSHIIDVSRKGLGNTAIITRCLHALGNSIQPTVVVQLTNVDKWDWYVENPILISKLQTEKHPAWRLDETHNGAFWSTGHHFPNEKAHYQQHYYSAEWHCFDTLRQILLLQMICATNQWPCLIIFDSPILNVIQQPIAHGLISREHCEGTALADNGLCQTLLPWIDWSHIYTPGIIGWSIINELAWHSPRWGAHPGSKIHLEFAKHHIFPWLDQWCPSIGNEELMEQEAAVMQKIFDDSTTPS